MENSCEFVERLKEWLAFKKVSTTEFAVGFSAHRSKKNLRSSVSNWLNGSQQPKLESQVHILEYLGLSRDIFMKGPEFARPPWPTHAITLTPMAVHCDGCDWKCDTSARVRIDEYFKEFLFAVDRLLSKTGSMWDFRNAVGITREELGKIGGFITVGQAIRIVYHTNVDSWDLPWPTQISKDIGTLLSKIHWEPKKSGNLFSFLGDHYHESLGSEECFYLVKARLKHANRSIHFLTRLDFDEREHRVRLLEELQKMLESQLMHRQLESAVLTHTNFHLKLYPDDDSDYAHYSDCLMQCLRLPTESAINDANMSDITEFQHKQIISLLSDRFVDEQELQRWYRHEHAYGASVAIMVNSKDQMRSSDYDDCPFAIGGFVRKSLVPLYF